MNYKLKEYDPRWKKTCYFPKRNINTYDVNTAAIIKYVNSDCEFIFYEGEPDLSNLPDDPDKFYSSILVFQPCEPEILFMDVALHFMQYIPLYNFPTNYPRLSMNEIPFDETLFMVYVYEQLEYLHKYVNQEIGIHRYHVFLPNYIRNHPEKLDFESLTKDERFWELETIAMCEVILNDKYSIEYRRKLYEIMKRNLNLENMKWKALSDLIEKIEKELLDK